MTAQTPDESGMCILKLAHSIDTTDDNIVLYPLNVNYFNDGSFICGEKKGLEDILFQIPEDYDCNKCIVMLNWRGYNKNMTCDGTCQNNGICYNGECVCKTGFYGDYCEEKGTPNGWNALLWPLLIALIIGGIYGTYMLYLYYKKINENSLLSQNNNRAPNPFPNEGKQVNQDKDVFNNSDYEK